MVERERITLEDVINIIGDEVGNKYTWFLTSLDAHGVISEDVTITDIRNGFNCNLGYYEVSWDFIKDISKKLSAVVDFHIFGSISRDAFLNERSKLNQEVHDWTNMVCELNFLIEDGEIWDISGKDVFLVKRLKKVFSKLPTLLW